MKTDKQMLVLAQTRAGEVHRKAGGTGPAPDALVDEHLAGLKFELREVAGEPEAPAPTLADAKPEIKCLATFRDAYSGREVRSYAHNQRISDTLPCEPEARASFSECGDALVTMLTGRPLRVSNAATRAMSEGLNTGGGLLVNEQLSSMIIDLARAKSRVLSAGAQTLAMDSDSMRIARISTDPTIASVAENAEIGFSDVAFDSITLHPKKYGAVVACSNELLADAPNAGDAIMASLSEAIAAKIDGLLLNGDTNIVGLMNDSRIDETDSVGAIDYGDLLAAQYAVRALNAEPDTVLLHPRTVQALAEIQEATTNAYKTPPAALETLRYMDTTRIANTGLLMGDFSQVLVGMRQSLVIRVSDEAGDSFKKDQTYIRALFRMDANLARPHFHRLLGLTY